MLEIREVKINAEQFEKEKETAVPLSTFHRFEDWPSALTFLAAVPDKDIVHMWNMRGYIKVAIVHAGAIAKNKLGHRV